MADYKKMYTGLCAAVDDSITALEAIPAARGTMHKLQKALEDAEEIYIQTSLCADEDGADIAARPSAGATEVTSAVAMAAFSPSTCSRNMGKVERIMI